MLKHMHCKLLLLLLWFSSISYANESAFSAKQSQVAFNQALQTAPLLYVVSAPQSSLKLVSLKQQEYQLTLHNFDPAITYFTNRPKRLAATLPIAEFISYWNTGSDSFAKIPPNAAIAATGLDNKPVMYVFTLNKIAYDPRAKTLTFLVKLVTPGIQQDLAQGLAETNLFIDFNWHGNIP